MDYVSIAVMVALVIFSAGMLVVYGRKFTGQLLEAVAEKEPDLASKERMMVLERELQELKSEWGRIRDDMFKYQASISRSWGHIQNAVKDRNDGPADVDLPDELPLEAAETAVVALDRQAPPVENRQERRRAILRKARGTQATRNSGS